MEPVYGSRDAQLIKKRFGAWIAVDNAYYVDGFLKLWHISSYVHLKSMETRACFHCHIYTLGYVSSYIHISEFFLITRIPESFITAYS